MNSRSNATRRTLDLLRQYESRNVTFMAEDGSWPIVWDRARGCHVWDQEGRRYLDLTAAFGVAAAGHANPAVVRAGQRQMPQLLHAMGDVHPHTLKAKLARELSRLTFERWTDGRSKRAGGPWTGRTIFGNSGFESVEAALKTARLATGRPGVVAFEGGYHGLGYGTLNVTHREHFRGGFRNQLKEFGHFIPFPMQARALGECERGLRALFRRESIGAVLVEPIQARGGIRVPPSGFLARLRQACDEHGALLILDEIYTRFGRTGRWFACENEAVIPDVVCLGKALTGGFPMSACVGKSTVMDAWPAATGEAIHTSTFLGHPVGCAMALAQVAELRRLQLPQRSERLGRLLLAELKPLASGAGDLSVEIRGRGLMVGLELKDQRGRPATEATLALINRLLARGFVFLPEGEHSNVLGWTPPLTITEQQLRSSVRAVARELGRHS